MQRAGLVIILVHSAQQGSSLLPFPKTSAAFVLHDTGISCIAFWDHFLKILCHQDSTILWQFWSCHRYAIKILRAQHYEIRKQLQCRCRCSPVLQDTVSQSHISVVITKRMDFLLGERQSLPVGFKGLAQLELNLSELCEEVGPLRLMHALQLGRCEECHKDLHRCSRRVLQSGCSTSSRLQLKPSFTPGGRFCICICSKLSGMHSWQ